VKKCRKILFFSTIKTFACSEKNRREKMPGKKKVKQVDYFNNVFQELLRINKPDPMIFIETHKEILSTLREIHKLTGLLAQSNITQSFPSIGPGISQLRRFTETFARFEVDIFKLYSANLNLAKKKYFELKNSDEIKKLQVIKHFLDEFKQTFKRLKEDPDAVNFINAVSGSFFQPFQPVSDLNFKNIWDKEVDSGDAEQTKFHAWKNYMANILGKFYNRCVEIDTLIYKPDVSIEVFTEIIHKAIDRLKKDPDLNRGCPNAIKKLQKSTKLLEEKFAGYYRDAVIADNYSSIFQSFVTDVAEEVQNGEDEILKFEFRKILTSFSKRSSDLQNNPKMAKLISAMGKMQDLG
jgi:hypothetical protein